MAQSIDKGPTESWGWLSLSTAYDVLAVSELVSIFVSDRISEVLISFSS